MTRSVFEIVRDWWARPSTRDRILAVLLEEDVRDGTGVQGLQIRDRARVGASLYTTLFRLEAEGLVRRTEGLPAQSRGGLPRYYYALTERGREAITAPKRPDEPTSAG
jgi:predicted ArsR family transcriptional regulator